MSYICRRVEVLLGFCTLKLFNVIIIRMSKYHKREIVPTLDSTIN